MKYASIDIETTGIDTDNCDIIEFAAVFDDLSVNKPIDQLPKYHTYILPPKDRNWYKGEPFALSMHSEKFKLIANYKKDQDNSSLNYNILYPHELCTSLYAFILQHNLEREINVAGKNFNAFDRNFIMKMDGFGKKIIFHRRVIDPAILYYQTGDDKLPDTKTCLKRAGIESETEHCALDDAIDIIKLVRLKLQNSLERDMYVRQM